MSKLQELIKELCPDGVEFRKLEEISNFRRGSFPQPYGNKEWYGGEGAMPFIQVADIEDNMQLAKKTKRLISRLAQPMSVFAPKGSIIISLQGSIGRIAVTQYDAYIDRTVAIFTNISKNIIPKYFVYQLQSIFKIKEKTARGSTIKTITKEEFTNFEIPLPPLEVQKEIVRILDAFTAHAAELQAELQARKEQYEYYRNKLLSFDENDEGVKWMRMEEVGTFIRGKRFVRTDIVEKGISCIHYGDMYTYYGLSANKTKGMLRSDLASKMRYAQKNDVVIVAAGENKDDIGVGLAWLGDEPAAVHDACFIFQSDMYPLFVSHYLRTDIYHKQIRKYVSEAKICSISAKGLGNAVIPVPSFERQQSIASLLDKFESLVNDLSEGLPAEIVAVQEQYEYYRNKLLTFKRKS
ncbi:restriction endonuclease subunit S [Phocaeicola coprophilus]|uniref:restriction endonuclease subunit S n=3 Tax=Phocaeicola coprophilus TaxID=387090 RepID=UPI0026595CA1|nr:restriction endonuclease subunit S [Phocaeicola coprophilus]